MPSPLLWPHAPKPRDNNHIPMNITPNPASTLTVNTENKGNAITKIPNIIAKIPERVFIISPPINPLLNYLFILIISSILIITIHICISEKLNHKIQFNGF